MRSACPLLLYLAACLAAGAQTGESLYLAQCAVCHGPNGEGSRGPVLAKHVLRHAPDDEALYRVIRRGIPNSGMPGTGLADREIRLLITHVRTLGRVVPVPLPGDPRNGEAIYMGKGGCGACHTIRGRGGAFGPDLTGIGGRRSPSHLRTSLTDPDADLPQGFVMIRAVTLAGRTVLGARVNEDTFSVQLRDAGGVLHSFFKSELREWKPQPRQSPMPGSRGKLSDSELDDLTAFLAQLAETAP